MSISNQLPNPTHSTKEGPIIEAKKMELKLLYDHEDDSGHISWIAIKFNEVLAYRFLQSICVTLGDNISNKEIAIFTESSWLAEISERWGRTVGWQTFQRSLGGKSRFRHYAVNFDDAGLCEIIASSYQVEG